MVTDIRPVENDLALLPRMHSSNDFDPTLVICLHRLKQGNCVLASVLFFVDFAMALMTYQQQVVQVIELLLGNSLIAPWAVATEGPDVCLLSNVDNFLSYG
jgi:hypothetical protein